MRDQLTIRLMFALRAVVFIGYGRISYRTFQARNLWFLGIFILRINQSIHAEMLQDKIRTEAYKDTIYNNHNVMKDKKVVDIGAGKL